MRPISVNIKLYYLLTYADGEVHEKEKEMGEKMLWHEAKDKNGFNEQIAYLEGQDKELILKDCIQQLLKFDKNDQINCLAWMCLIANADGFMDKSEWALIYKVYHKSLQLNLNEITARQKELHKFIRQYRNIPEESASTTFHPETEDPREVKEHEPELASKPKLAFPM